MVDLSIPVKTTIINIEVTIEVTREPSQVKTRQCNPSRSSIPFLAILVKSAQLEVSECPTICVGLATPRPLQAHWSQKSCMCSR